MENTRKSVLVIEDEESILTYVSEILELAGYRAVAANGAQMAEYLWAREEGAFDLILADCLLGERSGPDVVGWMALQNPQTKVIFMSGAELADFHAEDFPPGAQFLRKPFSTRRMLTVVHEVLSEAAPEQALAAAGSV